MRQFRWNVRHFFWHIHFLNFHILPCMTLPCTTNVYKWTECFGSIFESKYEKSIIYQVCLAKIRKDLHICADWFTSLLSANRLIKDWNREILDKTVNARRYLHEMFSGKKVKHISEYHLLLFEFSVFPPSTIVPLKGKNKENLILFNSGLSRIQLSFRTENKGVFHSSPQNHVLGTY